MGYAFISYSTRNQSSADAMRELFHKHGIETWMAPYDIPAGSKYAAVITKAIRDCGCFVLLLSNEAQLSEAVDSEVELAVLTYKKSIITIELEKVELNDSFTFYIHNKQIIPVHEINESSREIRQVLEAVSAYTRDTDFRRVPTILQRNAAECGSASLSMIFAYYGLHLSLDRMNEETCTTEMGCNAGELMRTAKRFGFECRGYKKEVQDLKKVRFPCIIHWNFNHFVVLEEMTDGFALINDPVMGQRRMTLGELAVLFTGVVLTFEPPADLQNSGNVG
ncbi:MAG: TIR domain-containing protein [Oscillospiraceae bacterium]|nr:TIR domain-containing protein [Oscillospiraceae bacterium]